MTISSSQSTAADPTAGSSSKQTLRTRGSIMKDSSSTTSSTTSAHDVHNGEHKDHHHHHTHEPHGIFSLKPSALDETGDDSECDSKDNENVSADQSPFCAWIDLPHWMQDNPAIWTGYRRPTFSYRKCLASLGFLHNESVNIYSHLLGAIACIVGSPIAYFKIFGVLETIRWTDYAVFYAFMAGAITCLSMSASFHTFSCHSEPVALAWNRCDYVGIVFLIVGSFYPAVYYGFYCHPTWQIMYISLISVFGAATIVAVIRPIFRTPQYRWIRSCLFLAMGLSAIFPIIHAVFIYGMPMARKAIAFNYMVCMGASYVIGALLYGSRTPERFFPGKFDHFGSSHQIFHICVLIGVLVHFLGVTHAMSFWHDVNHSCSIPIPQMRAEYIA